MNHQSQFARLSPGADAKAADARPSLLPASAATFNDTEQQTGTGTERGRARGVMCRFALAVAQDWSVIRDRAGSSLPRTCRSLHGFRPFPAATGRGSSHDLASINNAADHLLNNRSDRFPTHSKNSRLYGTNRRAGDIGLCPTPPRRSQKCLN